MWALDVSQAHNDVIILEGSAIVHSLSTAGSKNLKEYVDEVFIPYLSKQLYAATKLYVVWETYTPESLKESTSNKRKNGVRNR